MPNALRSQNSQGLVRRGVKYGAPRSRIARMGLTLLAITVALTGMKMGMGTRFDRGSANSCCARQDYRLCQVNQSVRTFLQCTI